MSEIKNSKLAIRLPLIIALAVVVGIFIGSRMLEPASKSEELSSNLTKFREVLTSIDKNYVDEVAPSYLVENAIEEMLDKLDPHSRYISAEKAKAFNDRLEGHYDGIGIQFVILDDTVHVVKALEGGPSKPLGIGTGDKIIRVGDEDIVGINIQSSGVADRLLGEPGTEVTITVLRGDEMLDFTIQRGEIPQKSVYAYLATPTIGYIKITNFGDQTYREFKDALERLLSEGMVELVLDLQGNPGGRMDAAERISDELIAGKRLIVSQKSVHKQYNSTFYSRTTGLFEEGAIVVLVDENSASASEIVAGALQDHDRALIVGRRTFGKGLVQLPITLNDQSEMMLTIARYYTPSGRSIQKPYDDTEEYHADITNRYNRGELFTADSMAVNDTLQFTTTRGRTVFGGGGITPDYFVPFDTSLFTSYYRQLVSSGATRKFALDYYQQHKKQLSEKGLDTFANSYSITDADVAKIVSIGEGYGVKKDEKELRISVQMIKTITKVDLADFIWSDEGYYKVLNPVFNEAFVEALDLFEEATQLAQAYQ